MLTDAPVVPVFGAWQTLIPAQPRTAVAATRLRPSKPMPSALSTACPRPRSPSQKSGGGQAVVNARDDPLAPEAWDRQTVAGFLPIGRFVRGCPPFAHPRLRHPGTDAVDEAWTTPPSAANRSQTMTNVNASGYGCQCRDPGTSTILGRRFDLSGTTQMASTHIVGDRLREPIAEALARKKSNDWPPSPNGNAFPGTFTISWDTRCPRSR